MISGIRPITLSLFLLAGSMLMPGAARSAEANYPQAQPPGSQLAAASLLTDTSQQIVPPHLVPAYAAGAQDTVAALLGMHLIAPVVLESAINSEVARPGDVIEARLKEDLRWGKTVVAAKNSRVRGHVVSSEQSRTLSQAIMSSQRKLQQRGCITVQFDEIIDNDNGKLLINAVPCKQDSLVDLPGNTHRQVATDRSGRIIKAEASLSENQKLAYNTVRAATILPIPASLMVNAVGVPAALGVAGAADPNFAFNKPVDPSMQHKRIKGFAYAFLSNLPGALLVQSITQKGNQVSLNPGDELILDIQLLNYQMPAPAKLDVSGSVLAPEVPPQPPPVAGAACGVSTPPPDGGLPVLPQPPK